MSAALRHRQTKAHRPEVPKAGGFHTSSSATSRTTSSSSSSLRRRWRQQLESRVLERVPAPREVVEFGQFEELSKLYAIEPPFVPRTRIQLMFDAYDAKKLRGETLLDGGGVGDDDGADDQDGDDDDAFLDDDQPGAEANESGGEPVQASAAARLYDERDVYGDDAETNAYYQQQNEHLADQDDDGQVVAVSVPTGNDCDSRRNARRRTASGVGGWCRRLLWSSSANPKRRGGARATTAGGVVRPRAEQQPNPLSKPLVCCVSASDTCQELNKCGLQLRDDADSVSTTDSRGFVAALEAGRPVDADAPTRTSGGRGATGNGPAGELATIAQALSATNRPSPGSDLDLDVDMSVFEDGAVEPDERALRAEAWQLMRNTLAAGRARLGPEASADTAANAAVSASALTESASALALDVAAAAALNASGRISVCVFDRRRASGAHHRRNRSEPLSWPRAQLSCDEPTNGPEWASACVCLSSLHRRWCSQLTGDAALTTSGGKRGANKASAGSKSAATTGRPVHLDERRLARLANVVARVLRSARAETRRRQQLTQRRRQHETDAKVHTLATAGADKNKGRQKSANGVGTNGSLLSSGQSSSSAASRVASGEQVEQLIELVKSSLNQLIDAQLLLRNKLTSMATGGSDQQNHYYSTSGSRIGAAPAPGSATGDGAGSSTPMAIGGTSQMMAQAQRGAEYENLLKNNFNLLKIWQNLEETKNGLVCFVCEPIKANLADLFWFNRHRNEWPRSNDVGFYATLQPQHQAAAQVNLSGGARCQQPTVGVGTSAAFDTGSECLIASPLVSLDAIQLKRGLMQVLEGLGYLHTVCKLIHRNVTPRNILIASNDNWKLTGLEFAIRFESTSINDSSSIMAHETRCTSIQLCYSSALRHSTTATGTQPPGALHGSAHLATGGGTGSGSMGSGGVSASGSSHAAPLRRQRTLHQTKCQEIVRTPKCLFLQPEVDYLAPEIWRTSKCSHKSDLFSYGLILVQAYDLCRHRSPLNCNSSPLLYDSELNKLDEARRKGKLVRQVPFEMRAIVLEMLETEPNFRPSANYAYSLLKRPIEMCNTNEDSLKHLRSSLAYLDKFNPISGASTNSYLFGADVAGAAVAASSGPGGSQQQQQQQQLHLHNHCATRLSHMRASIGNINLLTSSASSGGSAAGQQVACAPLQQQPLPLHQHQHQHQYLQQQTAMSGVRPTVGACRSYFRKVTSTSAQMAPRKRQQTSSLKMLNLMLRSIDSLAVANYTTGSGQHLIGGNTSRRGSSGDQPLAAQQSVATLLVPNQQQLRRGAHAGAGAAPFDALKLQCERTFANLKLALSSTQPSGAIDQPTGVADSRSLLLLIALHRRLLEQVSAMRADLPPVCRLIAPANSAQAAIGGLFGSDKTSQHHRALADLEERLQVFVGRHSIARLSAALADPTLKLDEFLLVFELVVDLLAFVGQKCRQSFAQRGKQLLNELMPVTGCPSSSSSEDDQDDQQQHCHDDNLTPTQQQQQQIALSTSNHHLIDQQQDLVMQQQQQQQAMYNGGAGLTATGPRQATIGTRMSSHRYSDLGEFSSGGSSAHLQHQHQQQQRSLSRASASGLPATGAPATTPTGLAQVNATSTTTKRQQPQLPTSINITAPSPMGSVRDLSARMSGDSACSEAAAAAAAGSSVAEMDPAAAQQISELMASQLSLSSSGANTVINNPASGSTARRQYGSGGNINNNAADLNTDNQVKCDQDSVKSRSQLIDELLKTINDDSFNEFIDFNNKWSAQHQQVQAGADNSLQQRPRSAIDAPSSSLSASSQPGAARNSNSSGKLVTSSNNQQQATSSNQQQQQQQHRHSTTPSTFDNVIRRMSTNFVQNFNKMSGSTGPANQSGGDLLDTGQCLRREKSSTPTGAGSRNIISNSNSNSNSLYVDNQIPARRHSDNTINVPRIQVALSSSPQNSASRTSLNPRASVSASKLANKWKLTAKSNQREASDKLSPNLGGALGYMRRHSSGNTTGSGGGSGASRSGGTSGDHSSNGCGGHSLLNASPFKTKSSSNLGLDFLLSNRSMKRRYSAASMLGHQTQRKAENLIDAGMKSVQNMFN